MKNRFKIYIIIILLLIYIYACNISSIPQSIILFQGETIKLTTIFGINLKPSDNYETTQTSIALGNSIDSDETSIGKSEYSLSLFNLIDLKNVTVNVIPKTKVIPLGNIMGLKLYTKGILVVGVLENNENKTDIKEGDMILTVNDNEISSTEELIDNINQSNGRDINITYDRNGEIKVANIKPNKKEDGNYKLGLWVRDAAAGVGTITYYEPSSKMFAALGHGIQDIDTDKLITISNGEIVTATITDVEKGKAGMPRRNKGKYI